MSDFDREAAREELREKFERDNEKRKTTQRMSELLLKGATMTNRHCDSCGDPIFRYQGQEFCPTCQNATVDGGPDSVQDDAESVSADSPGAATDAVADGQQVADDASVPVEPASPDSEEAMPADQQEATPDPRQQATADRQQTTTADHQYPTGTTDNQHPATDRQQATTPAEPAESPTAGAETDEPQPAPLAGDTADLDTARASLIRTLTRYSREAESADDPRRAKELLSVAHEAAETLSALDRTR